MNKLAFTFLLILNSFCAQATTTLLSPAIQSLVRDAVQKKLQEARTWKKLLHYESTIYFTTLSQIKDPTFFLANDGYKNAENELTHTLEGFFQSPELKDKHPICQFPARLHWLKQKLKDHPAWSELPKPICYYYDVYLRNLNAKSISFVFSSYYANNPGSAFGHTFFRVNKKAKEGKAKQELLDYGISYAAQVTIDNGFLYMINGLLGGFKGTYISVPYYYKVREYNDYESRDLWSYELNLTQDEVTQVIDHLWEVGPHYYDYYFFTQNCSFHMLTVLEAASDRIELIDKVPFYVIPSDSVKALYKANDFVSKVEFRPSLRKHFEKRWDQFTSQEKDDFISVTQHYSEQKLRSISFVNDKRKAFFYDALIDYADMKDPKGIANRQGPWHTIKEFLLPQRAEIPVISEDSVIPMLDTDRPEKSHPSGRVTLGAGNVQNKTFGYFQYRFAFNDLLDDSRGLPVYSQLEFFNFKFQFTENEFSLENFSFFNILQLNPLRRIDPEMSWGVDVGVKNMNLCTGSGACLGAGAQVFAGYAASVGDSLFWLLPFLQYRYSEQFTGIPNYAAVGYQLGYLFEFTQRYKFISRYVKEVPNRFLTTDSLSANIRFNMTYTQSLEIEWQTGRLSDIENFQSSKVLYHYFF